MSVTNSMRTYKYKQQIGCYIDLFGMIWVWAGCLTCVADCYMTTLNETKNFHKIVSTAALNLLAGMEAVEMENVQPCNGMI